MFTRAFWKAVAERAIKTAAQAAALAVAPIALSNLDTVREYLLALAYAMLGGAVLSVLTSLGSARIGPPGPSLGQEHLAAGSSGDGRALPRRPLGEHRP